MQDLFLAFFSFLAILAQLVERRYRKPQVVGPIPTDGSVVEAVLNRLFFDMAID